MVELTREEKMNAVGNNNVDEAIKSVAERLDTDRASAYDIVHSFLQNNITDRMLDTEVALYLNKGKIHAIKAVRERTGMGLANTKLMVEKYMGAEEAKQEAQYTKKIEDILECVEVHVMYQKLIDKEYSAQSLTSIENIVKEQTNSKKILKQKILDILKSN